MATRNTQILYDIITDLTNNVTISDALKARYSKRCVRLPIGAEFCNTNIDALELSTRGNNALKRSHMFTIGNMITFIEEGNSFSKINHMGKKTIIELLEQLLNFGFEKLSTDEQVDFIIQFIIDNEDYLIEGRY